MSLHMLRESFLADEHKFKCQSRFIEQTTNDKRRTEEPGKFANDVTVGQTDYAMRLYYPYSSMIQGSLK